MLNKARNVNVQAYISNDVNRELTDFMSDLQIRTGRRFSVADVLRRGLEALMRGGYRESDGTVFVLIKVEHAPEDMTIDEIRSAVKNRVAMQNPTVLIKEM